MTFAHTTFSERFSIHSVSKAPNIVKRKARVMAALGIALMVVGLLALLHFSAATIVSVYVLGAALISGGLAYGIAAISSARWNVAIIDMMAAILYIITGLLAFRQPAVAAVAITLVLAAFYLVNGLFRILSALTMMPVHFGCLLAHGIILFFLGLLIFQQWPAAGLWVIGVIVGVDLFLSGIYALITGGIMNRLANATKVTTTPSIKSVA